MKKIVKSIMPAMYLLVIAFSAASCNKTQAAPAASAAAPGQPVDLTYAAEKALQKELDKLAKADVETTVYTEYDEQFTILAWIIMVLILIEILICESSNPKFRRFRLFNTDEE